MEENLNKKDVLKVLRKLKKDYESRRVDIAKLRSLLLSIESENEDISNQILLLTPFSDIIIDLANILTLSQRMEENLDVLKDLFDIFFDSLDEIIKNKEKNSDNKKQT